jgi:hypothetical protein
MMRRGGFPQRRPYGGPILACGPRADYQRSADYPWGRLSDRTAVRAGGQATMLSFTTTPQSVFLIPAAGSGADRTHRAPRLRAGTKRNDNRERASQLALTTQRSLTIIMR